MFLVVHSPGYGESDYFRGVYASGAVAEAKVRTIDACDMRDHLHKMRDGRLTLSPLACRMAEAHDEICCTVDAMPADASPIALLDA